MSKSYRSYQVTPSEFVVAWQTSRTTREVSEKLGMPPANVRTRASLYRKRGIRLKKYQPPNQGRHLDIDALNALADKYASK